GRQFEFRSEKHPLVNTADEPHLVRLRAVDLQLDMTGRDVSNLAVKRQIHLRDRASIRDESIASRSAGELQSTADHRFIKAVEPAQSSATVEIDVLGM